MNSHISTLTEKIRLLEAELEAELAQRRAELRAVSYTHLTLPTNREV